MMAKSTKKEPDITILGEEIHSRNNGNAGSVVWGMLLLFSGIILLLNTLNILPWEIWQQILMFWPLLVVLAGVHIILGNNGLSRFLIFVISLVLFTLVLIIALNKEAPQLVGIFPERLRSAADLLNSYIIND